jgi:hypothetical protein
MSLDVREAYKTGYEEAATHIILYLLALQQEVGERHNYYAYAARQIEEQVSGYLSKMSMQEH